MQATEELTARTDPSLALGRYRVGRRLGAGGFGTVYEAHDERLDRRVALKVIASDGRPDERVRREAQAVARLDHPGIVAVFDAGEEEGSRYLISELVEGSTLAQLESAGALSDRDVVRIGLSLADALAHAHERGVVHRDVKPQNVMVPAHPRSPYGAAKLTDFGVAHLAGDEPLTRTGDVVGTLAYMAPEQAAGERTGRARRPLRPRPRALRGAGGREPGAGRRAPPPPRAGSARSSRRSRRPVATSPTSCARRSTARCARARKSAATCSTLPTPWPRRSPSSPTRAAPSPRTRSSARGRSPR